MTPWRCDATGDVADCFGRFIDLTRQGNRELEPEEGESTLLGFLWRPSLLRGASIEVDFWRIEYEDRIVAMRDNLDTLLEQLPPDKNPFVLRDAPTDADIALGVPGEISGLLDTFINADRLNTQGIDGGVEYQWTIGVDDFSARIDYSYLSRYELGLDFAGATNRQDVAGGYGPGGPLPRHRGNLSLEWHRTIHAVAVQLHYTGSYESGANLWANGEETNDSFEVRDWWALDAQYELEMRRLHGATLRVGCQNCLDEPPPDYNDTVFGENIHDGRGAVVYARWSQPL